MDPVLPDFFVAQYQILDWTGEDLGLEAALGVRRSWRL